ncbi:MAG: response regulator transcription factor, partial [Aquabacterium sp.]
MNGQPSPSLIIRLGLFDDHDIVRAGFRYILSQHSDIVIEAEGCNGRDAMQAIRQHPLDVCLLDLSMPEMSGIDVLRQCRALRPEMGVLILSGYSEEQYGLNMLKAGAAGFLSKT